MIKIRKLCGPYLTFYAPLDIYSNNIVAISLSHSHSPLSLWKDDNLGIFLNEERKELQVCKKSACVCVCVFSTYKTGKKVAFLFSLVRISFSKF